MTPAINLVSYSGVNAAPAPSSARPLPLSLRIIRCVSDVGTFTAVAALIYGIAANVFAFVAMGVVFLACTIASFYLIHQVADLKTVEEDTDQLKLLNASVAEKDAQIKQLIVQMQDLTGKMAAEDKEFSQLMQKDQDLQQKLDLEVHQSAEMLAKAQKEAKATIEQTTQTFTDQIAALKQQSANDEQIISNLNKNLAQAKSQIDQLNCAIANLQKQMDVYRQHNVEYSRLNNDLQAQIRKLTDLAHSPDSIHVSTINAHAAALEKLIAEQKAQAEKTAKMTADLTAALNRKTPKK